MMSLKKCKLCCQMNRNYLSINDKILENDLITCIKYLYQEEIPMKKISSWTLCKGCALGTIQAEIIVRKIRETIYEPAKKRISTQKKNNLTLNQSKRAKLDLSEHNLDTKDYQNDLSEFISESLLDTSQNNNITSTEQKEEQNTNNSIKNISKELENNKKKTKNTSFEIKLGKKNTTKSTTKNKKNISGENGLNESAFNSCNQITLPNTIKENLINNENEVENEYSVDSDIKNYKKSSKNILNNEHNYETASSGNEMENEYSVDSDMNNYKKNSKYVLNNVHNSETASLENSPKKDRITSIRSPKKNKTIKDEPNNENNSFKKIKEDRSIENDSKTFTDNLHSSPNKEFKKIKEKPFFCEVCSKSFSKKSKLDAHIQTAHIEKDIYDCPNCGLTFKSKSKFDKHVFSQKCQLSTYSCQQTNCNRKFSELKDMNKHMKSTHASELNSTEVLIE